MAKIVGRIVIEPTLLPGRNVQFTPPSLNMATFHIYWSLSEGLEPPSGFTSLDSSVDQSYDAMIADLKAQLAVFLTETVGRANQFLSLNDHTLNAPDKYNVFFSADDVRGLNF